MYNMKKSLTKLTNFFLRGNPTQYPWALSKRFVESCRGVVGGKLLF